MLKILYSIDEIFIKSICYLSKQLVVIDIDLMNIQNVIIMKSVASRCIVSYRRGVNNMATLQSSSLGNLTNLKARYIIPVDLNSIIYRNAQLLAQYNQRMGNESKVAYYRKRAAEWKRAVTAVLWHDEVGVWLDYDILNDIKRDYFYPTNILPLWTDCYDIANREEYVSKVLKYLEKNQIMLNLGGIPTTLEHSGEQWDYPNAWPPLQYFVVMSLNNTEDPWAQRLAYEISQRWVRSNWKAFNETHSMFEKVKNWWCIPAKETGG